ncbi:sugar ABC transporter substrate-binding protein [Vallitalea pronyensis]|uniref:Sugar ABC transporter substrate-binding protein n=1 Tax=Vallitalea pronyensis TaxID=1348613 RepID=A0A8J8MGB9_9FIRM|nr:sugar ABC transporter substrate-binding protein [Vallitalea pronyensis]QUI20956.1 sugar ABC transporter substrate-binding protein [Vallitalea pronyensis]
MFKKWIALLVVMCLMTTIIGCAKTDGDNKEEGSSNVVTDGDKNKGSDSDDEKKPEEPVTIEYMTFSASPDHIEDLEEMIAAFETAHPTIKVEYDAVGWNDYFTKLQTAMAGDNAPDTFELNYETFVTYASKGVLKDLSPYLKDVDTSVYDQTALDAFKYEGTQYGLVESFSNVVFFYNKDLFDQAGVAYPTKDWTWEDELEAAKTLTNEKEGIWGTYSPIQFWEFYKTIEQNGGKVFDDNGNVVINSPENVETLQWMIDKIDQHKVTPSDAQMSGQKSEDLFMAGKIAMMRTGIWMFGMFADAPFAWDITLEPGNTQKAHHFFSNGVAVSNKSKHADAAFKWISFLTSSKEATEIRVNASWELPAVSDKAVLYTYLEKEPPASREIVFEALETLVVPPVIEQWNELTDAVGKELEAAKYGTKSPQEALDAAKAAIEKIIK